MTDQDQQPTGGEGVSPPPAPSEPTPPASTGVPVQATASPPSDKEQRNWALFAHVSTFSWYIGIPGFVGPLIIWLIKKDEMPFAADQAKEALNFQISIFIYAIVCFILFFVVIGIPMLVALSIFQIIVTIIAAIQAGEGKAYRYPMAIRLIA